ncbi:MAG: bifunctional oligoribonuclease/PAP phosphatase NrnA [Candidatus Marinimicrobia bacterium]|nr:bifunctional oligoribonuclease/PAP phosphatase NrnA [Candidatus Neomarinimicrobiota bacterium]
MISDSKWKELNERLKFASRITITAHINPDGDAIGSELAFYYYLKHLGKDVNILNISSTPDVYMFLDKENVINTYSDDNFLKSSDLLIALDVSKFGRMGKIARDAKKNNISVITIDHHPKHTQNFFIQEIIDTSASSAGYLVYQFIKKFNPEFIDKKIALFLYCALVTDTGYFHYDNSSFEAHKMAGELVQIGISPPEVYEKLYEQNSLERIKLLGYILQNLQVEYDGKVVWFTITQNMLKKYKVKLEETECFSDIVRTIKNLKVCIIIKEMKDGKISVNLRSKDNVKINGIAHRLGGGGHPYASGIKFDKPLEKVIPLIVNAIGEIL